MTGRFPYLAVPFALAALLSAAGCTTTPAASGPSGFSDINDAPERRISQEPSLTDFAFEGAIMQGGMVLGTAPDGTVRLRLNAMDVPLSPDGRFLIAFDRDAAPSARLEAVLDTGRSVTRMLTVARRSWQLERVNVPLRPTRNSAAFEAQRASERATIDGARIIETGSEGWRQRFSWPATGRISGRFGAQRIYQGVAGSYHSGVDVALPTGTPVRAPADGIVVLATEQPFSLEGMLLMIDHGAGLNSNFLHLSRIDVRAGDRVRRGQVIGAVGATGRASGSHLHWGMRWRDARIDPAQIAGPMPVS